MSAIPDCRSCAHEEMPRQCTPLATCTGRSALWVWYVAASTQLDDDSNCVNPATPCPAHVAKETPK